MKILVYYGGRGVLEDPMLNVLQKIETVLDELRVEVEHINLYERKNQITLMPADVKEADGIILAASVEWLGIGGYLQQFLDACWLYADKQKIAETYMMPVVVSVTSGEKEAEDYLKKSWETLGGMVCEGICTYVEDSIEFDKNRQYQMIIEKKTEQFYRSVNQKQVPLPSSNKLIRDRVIRPNGFELTPQESEQLSKYVSDDTYVKKQKQDVKELAEMFKGMLDELDNKAEEEKKEKQEKEKLSLADHEDLKKKSRLSLKPQPEDRYVNTVSKRTQQENVYVNTVPAKITPQEKEMLFRNSDIFDEEKEKSPLSLRKETSAVVPPAGKAVEAVLNHMEQRQQEQAFAEREQQDYLVQQFEESFAPELGFSAKYAMQITDRKHTLVLDVKKTKISVYYDNNETQPDVFIRIDSVVLSKIMQGDFTFQKAFMSGDMTAKGNFKNLRMLDQLFMFQK